MSALDQGVENSIAPSGRRHPLLQFAVDAIGYGAASALALAVDWGLLVLLAKAFSTHYLIAASLSFSAGLVVAYSLSTTFVFRNRARYGARGEFIGFLITGLAGLALTQVLLFSFVDGAGLAVEFAKAPTAVLVFGFNFLTRRFFLFRSASV